MISGAAQRRLANDAGVPLRNEVKEPALKESSRILFSLVEIALRSQALAKRTTLHLQDVTYAASLFPFLRGLALSTAEDIQKSLGARCNRHLAPSARSADYMTESSERSFIRLLHNDRKFRCSPLARRLLHLCFEKIFQSIVLQVPPPRDPLPYDGLVEAFKTVNAPQSELSDRFFRSCCDDLRRLLHAIGKKQITVKVAHVCLENKGVYPHHCKAIAPILLRTATRVMRGVNPDKRLSREALILLVQGSLGV